MTTLKLLKKWKGFPAGHIIQYDDALSKELIAEGIAVIPGTEKEKPAEEIPKTKTKLFGKK